MFSRKSQTVFDEYLRYGIRIALLTRQLKPRADARVLVQASAFRQPAQRAFDHAELRFKLLVGQPFFIYAGERKQASVTAALQGEDVSLTKRAIGTMLHAAPALANHGTNLACSVFARVIVALLAEAQAPELEHLWVFANDEPCANGKRGEGHHRQQAKPNEENRNADEYDRHPCCKIETKFGSRTIQRLIDWLTVLPAES